MNDREFADLLDRYAALVCSVAVRHRLTPVEVDEVYSQTIMWAWEHRAQVKSREHMPRWLAKIARFKSLERLRALRRSAVPIDQVAEPVDDGDLPEDIAIQAEDTARVLDALERLTPKQRLLIERLFLSSRPMPYTDLAAELGVSIGSLGRMRQRALERLRRLLGEAPPGESGPAAPAAR